MADNDEDLNLPRAAINKIIKQHLPQTRVSVEARELIVSCCNEFIHLLSSESNDICNKQAKKTIMPDHVLSALKSLGFDPYVDECQQVLDECKNVALEKKKGKSKLENLGIPEDELLRQQQELFAEAQRKYEEEQWQQYQEMQQQQQQQYHESAQHHQMVYDMQNPPPHPGPYPLNLEPTSYPQLPPQ